MTPNEHRLIIETLYQQESIIAALVEALKGKGVIEQDDLTAYDELISSSGAHERLRLRVARGYLATAEHLGVQTGLPDVPPES